VNEPLAVLQRIRASRPRVAPRAGEHCELCTESIDADHGHVVDLEVRNLMCACRGCYLLFTVLLFDIGAPAAVIARAVPMLYGETSKLPLLARSWAYRSAAKATKPSAADFRSFGSTAGVGEPYMCRAFMEQRGRTLGVVLDSLFVRTITISPF
jgi:hypothetical protein